MKLDKVFIVLLSSARSVCSLYEPAVVRAVFSLDD
jgi:hypothetical protein